MTRLVLWDIDGTLLTVPGFGHELFAYALRAVTGTELRRLPDFGGRTDRFLVETVLDLHGYEPDDELVTEFFAAIAASARGRDEWLRQMGRVHAGAENAMRALADVPGVVQSLVTGNARLIAEQKLRAFGLASWIEFDVGGYGTEHTDRAVIVRSALERATATYGRHPEPVIVGDTAHDITAAKANGVRVVGVATGRTPAEELANAGADVVLPSLADTSAVLRALFP